MGDPVLNCVLAVCCPPLSASQQDALARLLVQDGLDPTSAAHAAKAILQRFDLAPAGTLQAFKDAIAEEARGADYAG